MPKKKARRSTASRSTKAASMAMPAAKSTTHMASGHFSFMQLVMMFVAVFIINSVVFYLANMFFPGQVVLGNHEVDMWSALISSMLILSAVVVGATPVIEMVADALRMKLTNFHWMATYFVINAVAIWAIARMAEMVGLGISSWFVVVVLALILDILQGMAAAFVSRLPSSRAA